MGLEVCQQLTGVMPTPLSDSQLGGALAGLGGIMGFQRIVKEILNINLPKEETRSDWLKRPLREEQIEYAVADVHYTIPAPKPTTLPTKSHLYSQHHKKTKKKS